MKMVCILEAARNKAVPVVAGCVVIVVVAGKPGVASALLVAGMRTVSGALLCVSEPELRVRIRATTVGGRG